MQSGLLRKAETTKSRNRVQNSEDIRLWIAYFLLLFLALTPTALASQKSGTHPRSLNESLTNYQFQSMDVNHLRQQANSREPIRLQLQDRSFEISLELRDLRGPKYIAVESLANGAARVVDPGPVQTFRGNLGPNTEGQARINFSAETMDALILTPDEWYFIEPLNRYLPQAQPSDVVVYKRSDIRADALGDCGLVAAEKLVAGIANLPPISSIVINGVPTTLEVQLATEADFEYVTALSGSSNANTEIMNIMNQVEGVYQTELGLTFQIVFQHTWDTNTDPYSSTDPSTMLGEFTNYWNANFNSVNYDMAHMWTGKDMDGSVVGIAWMGVTCFKSNAYGVSQRLTGTPAKYILTAHEMGHNFGAGHVSASNPGQSDCGNTIMNPSIGTGFTFCQYSQDQINAHVSTHSSCLTAQMTAPSNLTATADSSTQISLAWQDANSGIIGFKISRKVGASGTYSLLTTTASTATTYVDSGLSPNTTYFYRVAATTGTSDSPYSNEASATTSGSGMAISGFSPSSGPVATQVTIQGSGFAGITGVQFNGATATFTVVSTTQITAVVPPSATTGPIRVSTVSSSVTSATPFAVTSCSLSLSHTSQSFSSSGGSSSLGVVAGGGCSWTASSSVSWITVTGGNSGSGNGTVSFSVASNTSSASRNGNLTVGGLIFSVAQSGVSLGCSYTLSATSLQVLAAGGPAQLTITTGTDCSWSAASLMGWISLTSGNSGNGNSTVNLSILPNPGPGARNGSLVIAGQIVSVVQGAPTSGSDTAEKFVPVVLSSGAERILPQVDASLQSGQPRRNAEIDLRIGIRCGEWDGERHARSRPPTRHPERHKLPAFLGPGYPLHGKSRGNSTGRVLRLDLICQCRNQRPHNHHCDGWESGTGLCGD
ncbi:MAG: M12 family metallo-peptidase [Terriglobia bacterium]